MEIKITKTSSTGRKRFSEEERKFRQEASRLSSMANKRLGRLKEQSLVQSPAYKSWVDDGAVKFGIQGKTYNEVKAEVGRLNKFLNMSTSTVRETKKHFKTVANRVGITKFENIKDLQKQLNNFFEVSAKVKEYLHNSKEIGVAIGYQKVWEIVSNYVQETESTLSDVESDVMEITKKIVPATAIEFSGKVVDDFLDSFLDDL